MGNWEKVCLGLGLAFLSAYLPYELQIGLLGAVIGSVVVLVTVKNAKTTISSPFRSSGRAGDGGSGGATATSIARPSGHHPHRSQMDTGQDDATDTGQDDAISGQVSKVPSN